MVVQPDNPEEIKKAILTLKKDKGLYKKFKENGPIYVRENFSREKLAEKYIEIISNI